MSSPALLGMDASRPRSRSGILTPSSDASLNRIEQGIFSPAVPKRKRADSSTTNHLLKPCIAVKPHPPNLHIPPRSLYPLMVLPRENLSLGCIEFSSSGSELSQCRFYEAHVKVLDLESRMGSVPVVLLARSEPTGTVYALERQDTGLYVVCRLGNWINLEALARNATAVSWERVRPAARPESQGRASTSAIITPQLHKDQKKKRAAIEAIQSMVKKRARSQSICITEETLKQEEESLSDDIPSEPSMSLPQLKDDKPIRTSAAHNQEQSPFPTAPNTSDPSEPCPQQTAETIFENIRTQYFDALYKSMGSLAYFAKGPLSRARSAFHLDLESNLDMGDLIDFLKSLILTTVQIDKKYRETIPAIVGKLTAPTDSSDEGRKKKRRSKKMKIGKDGLYPFEMEHIRTWWSVNMPEVNEDETSVHLQQIKSLASMLRTRETQLQMILIFEILALEPLKAAEDAGDSNLPDLPGAESQVDISAPTPPRKRNKHNLPVLVDVHADRLTIWQSTATDEQIILEDTQTSRQPGDGLAQKSSSEPLKDFCVDVVVPFFSARLPELCDSINRKLGGPVIISSSRPKAMKRSSSKHEQKPGSITKRPTLGQVPRALQRALSTEQQTRRSVSRGPSNMIALMRSATSTSLPGVKREGSEPVAARNILKADPNLLNRRRGLLSRTTSMSDLKDSKTNKKALVDAQLKDAINSLRKPNREVVGKAMAEAAQRQASTSVTLSAKKRKQARHSLGTPVQVKATPTNNRFKDIFTPKPQFAADVPLINAEEVIPPSSINSRAALNGLGNTPTKQSSFLRRPAEPAIPLSSPGMLVPGSVVKTYDSSNFLARIGEGIFATPVKRSVTSHANIIPGSPSDAPPAPSRADPFVVLDSAVKEQQTSRNFLSRIDARLFETPVKKMASYDDENIPFSPTAKPVDTTSIYQRLGWDDDMDDL